MTTPCSSPRASALVASALLMATPAIGALTDSDADRCWRFCTANHPLQLGHCLKLCIFDQLLDRSKTSDVQP
ncbi:hypothetical protein ACERNI_05175 [Camelimonas sp. ID_303_24]